MRPSSSHYTHPQQGILQGHSLQDLKEAKPEHYAKYMAARAAGTHYDPPGSESLQQLCDRMWAAFTDICARHRGQKVLVVSHGAALHTLLTKILLGGKFRPVAGEPPYLSFTMTNTALNVVSVAVRKDGHDSPPRLVSLGDVAREHKVLPTQRTAFPIFGSATTTFAAGFLVGVGAAILSSFVLRRKS